MGTATTISVPWPGALRTVNSPLHALDALAHSDVAETAAAGLSPA
jgi:hypothetical protein